MGATQKGIKGFIKGYPSWNKGKHSNYGNGFKKGNPGGFVGKKHTPEAKEKIRKALQGHKWTSSQKLQFIKDRTGTKRTIETRKKMSDAQKGERGSNWKGGITPINRKIRKSLEYKLWREAVLKRDNWVCVFCYRKSKKGKKVILNADHIKPFAYFPELRFAIDNGRTLCDDCHKKTDTYGGKVSKILKDML